MKSKISALNIVLTIILISCIWVSIFMSVISYVNYKGHLTFCEEQEREISQEAKQVEIDSDNRVIYNSFYVDDVSFYNGICLEGDGVSPKLSTIWGITAVIFIFITIISLKIDNLKKN